MRAKIWPLTALLLLTSLPLTSLAQGQRWFEVEVIVFERTIDATGVAEAWPDDASISGLQALPDQIRRLDRLSGVSSDTGDGDSDTAAPASPDPANLRRAERQLTSVAERLQRHSGYQVLFHQAWQQPVENSRRARAIRIRGGDNFANRYEADGRPLLDRPQPAPEPVTETADGQVSAEPGDSPILAATPGPAPVWGLDGRFRLWLETYLFIDSELLLRRPEQRVMSSTPPADSADGSVLVDEQEAMSTADSLGQPWLMSYPFNQQRRLRSGEIHYFDHPLMGMLVQIRRLDGK